MNAGDVIPALERTITLTDMVAYAGATWDWHRLHYDLEFVGEKGLSKSVVDGQMLGALMAEQLLDHLGPAAFIAKLEFRFRAMVFAGDTVRVEAEVTSVDDGSLDVAQRVMVRDLLAVDGTAEVRL